MTDTNVTSRDGAFQNRIEPWEHFEGCAFQRLPDEIIGTVLRYNGAVLRMKGDYSDVETRALFASTFHMRAEGYHDFDRYEDAETDQ